MRYKVVLVSELDQERIAELRAIGYRVAGIDREAFNEGDAKIDGFFMRKRIDEDSESEQNGSLVGSSQGF